MMGKTAFYVKRYITKIRPGSMFNMASHASRIAPESSKQQHHNDRDGRQ